MPHYREKPKAGGRGGGRGAGEGTWMMSALRSMVRWNLNWAAKLRSAWFVPMSQLILPIGWILLKLTSYSQTLLLLPLKLLQRQALEQQSKVHLQDVRVLQTGTNA